MREASQAESPRKATGQDQMLTIHSDCSHGVFTQVLSDLEQQSWLSLGDFQGVQNWRQIAIELHVHDGTNDCDDFAILARR